MDMLGALVRKRRALIVPVESPAFRPGDPLYERTVARFRCAANDVPRDNTRGITISPFAPDRAACAASAAARLGLCAPVPTTTGTPALVRLSTPCMRCSSDKRGQSPIEPQYTTPDMPASTSSFPLRTNASKSG